ncbi:hypothetical protein BT69DRAFT_1328968 [Atractiella rhizophila]|nr:hypothetical protein BT69DRAFT_1328968 [Atractiella rhizophila]
MKLSIFTTLATLLLVGVSHANPIGSLEVEKRDLLEKRCYWPHFAVPKSAEESTNLVGALFIFGRYGVPAEFNYSLTTIADFLHSQSNADALLFENFPPGMQEK